MANDLTLVADVGGTNTRFALADQGGLIAGSTARYPNADVDGFIDIAHTYLATLTSPKPTRLCVAIAGPVAGGKGKLTNGDWVFDTSSLSEELGIAQSFLLNDLSALGHALDILPATMVTQIGGAKPNGSQTLVAGIATGFNVSLCHDGHVSEAELGHASMPTSVMKVLRGAIGDKAEAFRTVETLLSGSGLSALHIALGHPEESPATITGQDGETVDLFANALGTFCRELTYQYMPFAGLYLNGSVARAVVGSPNAAKIIATQAAKDETFAGRFGAVPLYLITEDNAALFGCARYAQTQRV
jgi:glucokinase